MASSDLSAKNYCKQCGSSVGLYDEFCTSCGARQKKGAIFGKVFLAIMALLFVLAVIGWFSGDGRVTRQIQEPVTEPRARKVTYRVQGYGRASLTYTNSSGGTEQRAVTLPWYLDFRAAIGQSLYLSAQKQAESGSITATIYVEGVEVQTATSDAAYGIASVNGIVR